MAALAKAVLTLGLVALTIWAYATHFGGADWIAFASVLAVLDAL